jgi:SAM-dependent methyltransferase
VQTGLCESIDAFDLAAGAIEVARRKAHEAGVTTINFFIEDANKLRLPPETYDFIFASNALHHIENLENLFEQVNQALTPNGLFFGDDYVGPSRMQWSPLQLTLMNRMLKCLPERYRVNSLMNDQGIKHMIERIPIEIFLEKDPSEGVRAAEILPQLERHLVPVEIKPLGGSLVYDLLLGIIQNFDDNDENDVALLRILCQCEAILIEQGILSSDFAYFAARKRSTAHLSDTPLRARK